jgi:DNA-binding IclR family transcriptional regulator
MRLGKKLDNNPENGPEGAFPSRYIVPAVDRAARILSLLGAEGREMTIAQIADATGWHKSSVHKLLLTLNYHGLLDRDQVTKRYSLGVMISEYGRIALNGLDVRKVAKPFLKALVEYTGDTAALAILRGTKITLVDIEESSARVHVSLSIGMKTPATTTSNGKAVLAYLPKSRCMEIMRIEGLPAMTKKSITNPEAFLQDLVSVRRRGYATDYEEYQEGVFGISAPVFDSEEQVLGALYIARPAFKTAKDKTRQYGSKCAEIVAQLSAKLKQI